MWPCGPVDLVRNGIGREAGVCQAREARTPLPVELEDRDNHEPLLLGFQPMPQLVGRACKL